MPDLLTDPRFQWRFAEHLQHGVFALPGCPEFSVQALLDLLHASLEFFQVRQLGAAFNPPGLLLYALFQAMDTRLQGFEIDGTVPGRLDSGIALQWKTPAEAARLVRLRGRGAGLPADCRLLGCGYDCGTARIGAPGIPIEFK